MKSIRTLVLTLTLGATLVCQACGAPPDGEPAASADQAITVPPWIACYDYLASDFDNVTAKAQNDGYFPISVSAWGTPDSPRYAGVFVKRSRPAWNIVRGVGNDAWQQQFTRSAQLGFKPIHVSFDGDAANPVWVAAFQVSSNGIPYTRNGLYSGDVTDPNAIEYWLQFAHANALIPSTMAIYGTGTRPAYAIVLEPNTAGVQWSVGDQPTSDDKVDSYHADLSHQDYQANWDALVPAGNRVGIVDLNGGEYYVAMYRDDYVGPVVGFHGMTRADLDSQYAAQKKAGYFPISIQGGGGGVDGSPVRFAALFAKSDLPLAKTLRSFGSGARVDAPIPAIDDAVTRFMSAHDVRQASLAVLDGKKLAYARGYDLEEPGLGLVGATSTFRLASVSKVVTAMEIMHLVDQGQLALTDDAQSILRLTTWAGAFPASPFETITVQNLLQHQFPTLAGNCLLRDVDVSQSVAMTLRASLPLTRDQALSFALGDPNLVTRAPDPNEGCYSNLGYILLGQIIEAKRGMPYLAAVQADLFAPLSITRDRLASFDASAQPAGEAEYRPFNLRTTNSVDLVGGEILAELPYGGDNWSVLEAAGGLSMASTDVARLLAVLGIGKGNPVYQNDVTIDQPSTVQQILDGRFGFDQAFKDKYGTHYVKGGELAGIQTTVNFVQGGISYVLFFARDGLDGLGGADNWWPTWGTLDVALAGASLGARPDLFPYYGMPSL
jgi:CubicO group peptidase (beta-lactamase class C family)